MTRSDCLKFALLASTALSAPALAGDRLPTGADVAHGSVGISTPSSDAMTIRQSSDTAIVNWRGFSIGQGARVDIHQPSTSSAILNRVTGATPSSIAGQLNANGQVYLINPNGIAITPTGTVRTGAFVASTLAATDEDFIAGRRNFRGNGRSAAVVNQGSIEVGPEGYAALIGGKVTNSGTITARMGRIGLGAGERATLDVAGDGFLQVAVPSDDTGDDAPLITHTGRLSADGGRVELKAATARQMARQVINLSGVVEARSVSGRSGAIVLGGGDGGRVRVSGRLDAGAPRAAPEPLAAITPPPPRPQGGSITVTGSDIELAGATLDASGPGGGGTVRVGGDWQGGGTLAHATTASVDAGSLIAADALDTGDGGSVVVWSDEHTAFAGRITARGGPLGGDGGAAEVSGKATLSFTGIADLSATNGSFGTLLLDPSNIVIDDGETTGEFVPEDCCIVEIIEDSDVTFEPGQPDSVVNAGELMEQLGFANVVVSTASGDEEDGNITVNAPLSWTSAALLSLVTESGDITVNATITTGDEGGLLTSTAGTTAVNAGITVGAAGTLDIASGAIAVTAPIVSGEGATLNLAASGNPVALADLALGAGTTLDVSGTTIDLNGPVTAGDGTSLTIAADDSPLTVNGAFTLGNDVTLDLSGGGVTLNGALTAGEAGLIAVDSGGSPVTEGNTIAVNGAVTTGAGTDLALDADDGIGIGATITTGTGGALSIATAGTTAIDGALSIGADGTLDIESGEIAATAPVTAGAGAALTLAAAGAVTTGDTLRLGAGSVAEVTGGSIDLDGAIDAGDDAELSFTSETDILVGAPVTAPAASLTLDAGGDIGLNAPIAIAALESAASTTSVNAPITIGANGTLSVSGTDTFLAAPIAAGDGADLFFSTDEGVIDVAAAISLGEEGFLTFSAGGDLVLAAPITWGAFSEVDAFATNTITITGALSGPSGELEIGAATINPNGPVDVGTFALSGGAWVQLGPTLPAFSADDFRIEDGEAGDASFLRALGGDGTAAAPYLITDVYGLQGIGSADETDAALPDLADAYALANDIDANGTFGWNDFEGAQGFVPIGVDGFLGSLDGNGFAIDGLFIDLPFSGNPVGLFSALAEDASVENLRLTDVNVTGSDDTGALAGANDGSITRVLVSGTVRGTSPDAGASDIGGLVGTNFETGTVTESISDASVTGSTEGLDAHVGGLAGHNFGTIVRSAATGSVSADAIGEEEDGEIQIGGLVGVNQNLFDDDGGGLISVASITDSYSTALVTATVSDDAAANGESDAFVGGLVGVNGGETTRTYAAGPVVTNEDNPAGGLVGAPGFAGLPPGTVTSAFWDTETTGQADSGAGAGIGTGLTTAEFEDTEGFMALATAGTPAERWDFDTTWAPPAAGFHPGLYVVNPVIRVNVDDASRQYAAADPEFTSTNVGGPGTFAFGPVVDPIDIQSLLTTDADTTSGVGTYDITTRADSAISSSGIPYRLVTLDGELEVTPRSLTITADDQTKRYGRTLDFRGTEFTARGLVNGDTVTSVDLASLGSARGANVGRRPFAITASNADGDGLVGDQGLDNYAISYVPGSLSVTPAPLVVTARSQEKPFGSELVFNGTEFTTRGLVNGDRATSALLRSDGAQVDAPFSSTPYPIDISGAEGPGLSFDGVLNYDITYVPGELFVVPGPPGGPDRDLPLQTFDAGLRLVYYDFLPNPADVIEIAATEDIESGGGSGGPTLGPTRPTGTTLARETAEDTLTFVEALSSRLETRVSACQPVPPNTDIFLACVRDALSDYASELDSRILDLPPPLRQVSAVIRQSASQIEGVRADAARRIALATSDAEIAAIQREATLRAGAALETAIVEIRQAIGLIRAEDDPQLASLQTRQGTAITAALQNVEEELTRAVGL